MIGRFSRLIRPRMGHRRHSWQFVHLEDRLTPAALLHVLNPAGIPSDRFGWAVANSDTYRVVAQPYWDGAGGANTGNVIVYDAATNQPLINLENPSGQIDSLFGSAVALSGHYLVVAANGFDTATASNVGIAYVFDLNASTPTTPAVILSNPQPNADDQFGFSVAIAGQTVVIGSSYDDTSGTDAGSVYVYNLASPTPGLPLATLSSPIPGASDYFGYAVAASGTFIVVGEVYSDFGAAKSGSAYVFDLASPAPTTPIATLRNPTPASSDQFGVAVAISGQTVVVGANLDDAGASNSGMAYVYDLTSPTPSVPALTLNNPSPAANDYFGRTVAVSGPTVVVAAYYDDAGATDAGVAYAYNLTSQTPNVPTLIIYNPEPAVSDRFGYPVAISGNSLLIGNAYHESGATDSGVAYVFDLGAPTPATPVVQLKNHVPARNDSFGRSVSVSGQYIVASSYGNQLANTSHPSVYVYDMAAKAPTTPVLTLMNPSPSATDNFGATVAVAGKYVVVGDPFDDAGALNAGRVYVYEIGSANPTAPIITLSNPTPVVDDYFGSAVAVSGPYVVVGAYLDNTGATDSGAAYVYDLTSKTPNTPILTLNNPLPAANDWFGFSVAISGKRVIIGSVSDNIGAIDAGAAFVYDIGSATPTLPIATLIGPTPSAYDYFGYSVAISGSNAVVGAYLTDSGANNSGAAYTFELSQSPPTLTTLNNPAPGEEDNFGASVSISDNMVVVGTQHNIAGAIASDSAYVYQLGTTNPADPIATLHDPLTAADVFGSKVAISGQIVVMGAPREDSLSDDNGAAYVYNLVPVAKVAAVTINTGAAQRSSVTALTVTFDQAMTFIGSPSAAFQLNRQGDNATVTLSTKVDNSGPGTAVTLSFIGGAVDAGSLADGRYTLIIHAAQISSLDGNGDGTSGDDFVLVGDPSTNKLFRLFGDNDGDNDVDTSDFGAFRIVFGNASPVFDFDNDGDVDTGDFGAFRARFGATI